MTKTASTQAGPIRAGGAPGRDNGGPDSTYRAVSAHPATAESMGPLADLPGFWSGTGFGIIARPDHDPANPDGFFLQLNLLRESIEFQPIGSPVINRGAHEDVALFGVTYLHRVTDDVLGSALHIETGSWLLVPPTGGSNGQPSVVRISMIPHGNAVCASGFSEEVVPDGPIEIPPANTVPFPIGGTPPAPGTQNPFAAYDLGVETPYRTAPLPPAVTQSVIDDPNNALRAVLDAQDVRHITRLIVSTAMGGGIGNIPFITDNADVPEFESVFAIERIVSPQGDEFMQLQYAQTALLNFRGMSFPHVTVGTLVKAF